ncbi:MAG: hypothetical protein ACRD2H_09770 [Terriglobales bacterium]
MALKPGTIAPQTGVYWCSVCKLPGKFDAGQVLPECRNKCGRGGWDFVQAGGAANPAPAPPGGPPAS